MNHFDYNLWNNFSFEIILIVTSRDVKAEEMSVIGKQRA